ncbi:MAG: tetratricopeptide repeat protein, partial [Acidobacteriota bacterium]|nr:tetratricopeptide repeat protein [Acidobacteriota bacterium]
SEHQVQADLSQLRAPRVPLALPFKGFYIKETKRDFFKFGVAFLWAGFPELALPYLERVLERQPENPRILVLAGQVHFLANRLDEAERCFTSAAQFNPNSTAALLGLADIASKRDQQARAATFYGKALALDAQSAEAANGLGLALAKQGQLEDARKYFEQAIAIRRNYAEAINNLGVLYIQQNKTGDAIAAFTYGIKVSPDEDILYLNLGRTYVQNGQPEKAKMIMQQLLERKPNNPTARKALQDLEGR